MTRQRSRGSVLLVAAITVVILAWLASHPEHVHRSLLDPAEPAYTSNYLDARGFLFPWLIVEVPPELGHVPVTARLNAKNAGILLLVALTAALCLVGSFRLARMVWRRLIAGWIR